MKRGRTWGYNSGRAPKRVKTTTTIVPARSYSNYRPRTYTRRFAYRTGGVRAQTETKYFDTSIPLTNVMNIAANGWTGTEIDPAAGTIFAPAAGSAYNQREGKKVYVKKIKVKGQLLLPVALSGAQVPDATRVRLVLYMDKQTNGVQAQGEDVLAGNDGTNNSSLDFFQNAANFGRFRVLKDKTFTKDAPNFQFTASVWNRGGQAIFFKMSHKFKTPLRVNYNTGANNNISDVVDNSFHLIAACQTANATLPLQIQYRARTIFCE